MKRRKMKENARSTRAEMSKTYAQHGQDNTGCDAVNSWMTWSALFWLDTDGWTERRCYNNSARSVCAVFGSVVRSAIPTLTFLPASALGLQSPRLTSFGFSSHSNLCPQFPRFPLVSCRQPRSSENCPGNCCPSHCIDFNTCVKKLHVLETYFLAALWASSSGCLSFF